MKRAIIPVGLVTIAMLATAGTSEAAKRGTGKVRIRGGTAETIGICPQKRRPVVKAKTGQRVRVRVRRRHGARVIVSKCLDGRFKRVSRKRKSRFKLSTLERKSGDYRVRVRGRKGRSRGTAFVRVGAGEIVDAPVSFSVINQNRANVGCQAPAPDGKTYKVRGTITGPRSLLLSGQPPAALYYHGLSYGAFFFRFQAVPGYDYALRQARAGHVSVVVDRLGYRSSEGPDGNDVCYGSQADIADQIITQMKSDGYRSPVHASFGRVALVGHSAGGFIAQIAQYTYHSGDALAIIDFADQGQSGMTIGATLEAMNKCSSDPDRAHGDTGPANYSFVGQTDEDYKAGHIFNADPKVVDEVLKLRTRDPCGDLNSIPSSLVADQAGVAQITVPVLALAGANDALFPPPSVEQQADRYGSQDSTYVELPKTGHAVTLGRTHEKFRKAMGAWLTGHGY